MKLIHLIPDDKFVDMAVREFEAVAPGQHEWLVLEGRPPWRYLKDPRVRGVTLADFEATVRCADVTGLVLHTLYGRHFDALAIVPAGLAVTWLGWGYDYYGMICDAFPQGYILPTTAALLAQQATFAPSGTPSRSEATVLSWARPYARPTPRQRELLRRIDIFSPVIDTEYQLVRRHVPELRARYVRWNYATVEDDLRLPQAPCAAQGPNLLVGNSATATNNHLEIFDLIHRQVDMSQRQLIVPLSYGDAAYRNQVVQRGRAMFGRAFVPLLEFMPLDRYIELLGSCGHVLMNHIRQQALGNLVISGLMGAKLHLNPANPLHHWLRSLGIAASDVQQLDLGPLPLTDRTDQVRIFETQWGRTLQRQRTAELIDAMSAHQCHKLNHREPA